MRIPVFDDVGEFKEKTLISALKKLKIQTYFITKDTVKYLFEVDKLVAGSTQFMEKILDSQFRGIVEIDFEKYNFSTHVNAISRVDLAILKYDDIPHMVSILEEIFFPNPSSSKLTNVNDVFMCTEELCGYCLHKKSNKGIFLI